MMPQWAQEGGREQMLARLKNPATRKEIGAETVRIIREERGGGDPKNVFLAHCDFDASMAGKNLADVARMRGMEPTIENGAEAAMWVVEQGNCQGVYHAMSEQDLERIMRHPATMIASDGWVQIFGEGVPHPRSYGTFPRVLGVYVRERNVITLEDAIRKMTSFPAQRLRLGDRGVLQTGHEGRHHRLRSGACAGHGDVRKAAPVRGRILIGYRERASRVRREGHDVGATGKGTFAVH